MSDNQLPTGWSEARIGDLCHLINKGAGGWRAACLHIGILRDTTDELFYCKFGVEVPIGESVLGSRVTHTCYPGVKPVILTPRATTPR